MTNQMERYKLYQWIHMVSFAVVEFGLYLDTHPEDLEAMEYFKHFQDLRTQALKEYECQYGPLTIDTATPKDKWQWSTEPWPWEGGCF